MGQAPIPGLPDLSQGTFSRRYCARFFRQPQTQTRYGYKVRRLRRLPNAWDWWMVYQKRQCPSCGSAAWCIFRDMRRWALHRLLTWCMLCSTRTCHRVAFCTVAVSDIVCGPHRPPAAIRGVSEVVSSLLQQASWDTAWCSFLFSLALHCQRPKVSIRRNWTQREGLHDLRDRAWRGIAPLHGCIDLAIRVLVLGTQSHSNEAVGPESRPGRGGRSSRRPPGTNHDARPGETAEEPQKPKQLSRGDSAISTLATLLSGRGPPLSSHAPCARWRLGLGNWRHFPPPRALVRCARLIDRSPTSASICLARKPSSARSPRGPGSDRAPSSGRPCFLDGARRMGSAAECRGKPRTARRDDLRKIARACPMALRALDSLETRHELAPGGRQEAVDGIFSIVGGSRV